ncbi:unnamed protein product [Brassicogethes aeneus]|uniref:Uncharacterized protein n=1 Tax=Brassicogethes aeneus TaxID=1431903 RepID=A0A9P0ATC9_BRAAE|nr:unnamed protein product [Brassicogethes aeneus]
MSEDTKFSLTDNFDYERSTQLTTKKLIAAIKTRNALWDPKACNYNKRGFLRGLWDEVATIMHMNENTCKTKWKNLRDSFIREFKKYKVKYNKCGKKVGEPRWVYYKDLKFLTRIIMKDNQVRDDDDDAEYDTIGIKEEILSFTEEESNETNHFDIKIEVDEPEPKKLRIENSGQTNTIPPVPDESMEQNSDYYFLISLLPYMKKIPEEKKLLVRNKIQNVILDEENTCKTKWKNLRDSFIREFKKYKGEPRWVYYKDLKFLTRIIMKDNQVRDDDDDAEYDTIGIKEEILSFTEEESNETNHFDIKIEVDEPEPKKLRIENSGQTNIIPPVPDESMEQNSDYYFLISLLPYMKKIPEEKKLLVRNKIQNVILDEGE